MKPLFVFLAFLLSSIHLLGQKKIYSTRQVAFVYFENRKTNLIVIPNIDRLYSFKIFRKIKTDTTFHLVAEKKKPALPTRNGITPYNVSWKDIEYNTTEVEYKIISFDKKGQQICELKVIWENLPDTNKNVARLERNKKFQNTCYQPCTSSP